MNKLFYPKLAAINIKKNSKTYLPFIITCICTISMFYIMHALSMNEGIEKGPGASAVKNTLQFGTIVIGIFSAIFLFYTNSFLIKRRKKEIGLYNVLGLEKKHISKILFFEFIYTLLFSLIFGLISGIILNKLMFLALLKILNFKVAFGFQLSVQSILFTLTVFVGIFVANLLFNLIQIKILKPIELLRGNEIGEKEPKTKWLMTLVGLIALISAYVIALTIKSPVAALGSFFIAVILVMIGTYALFTAGSIAVLKILRKNKRFYYKTTNFISVSGMMYRMKQNAVGLANICILSTCVLVMISTTVSLYLGVDDAIKNRYPREIMISSNKITEDQAKNINEIIDAELKNTNINLDKRFNYWNNEFNTEKNNENFQVVNKSGFSNDLHGINLISISDYNRITGENISLKDDEAVFYSNVDGFDKNSITIENKVFKIKKALDKPIEEFESDGDDLGNNYFLFVNNIDLPNVEGNKFYDLEMDVNGSENDLVTLTNKIREGFSKNGIDIFVDSAAGVKEEFFSFYGGMLFIGVFLGALFLMATVLIIYYKQVSEGYDDKERFDIMQKVGMSKAEIKKTISRQILMVFFLPLITAIIHVGFAFPMITKILKVLNITNVNLFMWLTLATILVFVIIYGIVFSLTARAYYKIVE
ncbi:ABC transporter permease [Clostridium intestinale]|uniref:ABC transporter permease n=1 Tax=Clostridium intestinale TaxID=36845 RepID=UPI002DD62A35|nr:ABC transporter permease [Clostridium intestinale]WRY51900.1 ABC transporter permease [Clostridium intestinale]